MKILIGFKWIDAKRRTWEVYKRMPFGRFMVRTTDLSRVGEMRGIDIKAEVAANDPTVDPLTEKEIDDIMEYAMSGGRRGGMKPRRSKP
jgi:hypothetical protein